MLSRSGQMAPHEVDAYLRVLTRMASHLPHFLLSDVGVRDRLALTWDGPGISLDEQNQRIEKLSRKNL